MQLSKQGFLSCDALGVSVVGFLLGCQVSCSKQASYDFGLQAMMSATSAAGDAARAAGYTDENALVCDAVAAPPFAAATEVRHLPTRPS